MNAKKPIRWKRSLVALLLVVAAVMWIAGLIKNDQANVVKRQNSLGVIEKYNLRDRIPVRDSLELVIGNPEGDSQ